VAERIEADVAVVGAGPAGIAAAVSAAEAGRRVVMLDEGPRSGGQIWRHRAGRPPREARRWLERLARSGARVLAGASVADAEPGFELLAERGGESVRVRAGRLVLATGARERFLPFPGWTLPNVVGVGAAQALLKSGASLAGARAVVAGSGPLLLPVAAALARSGARVEIVAEQARAASVRGFAASLWRSPTRLVQAARYRLAFRPARYAAGTWVERAEGDDRVREVWLTDGLRRWKLACGLLCVGYGLVPSTELACLLGCSIEDGEVMVDSRQETSVAGLFCAGEPAGIAGVEAALVEGQIAGRAAAGRPGAAASLSRKRDRGRRFARRLASAFALRSELRDLPEPGTLVCRCEDVPLSRLRPEWSARQAKLYTRAGMGPCQGRVCGSALEFLFGWKSDTVRPPAVPVSLATLRQGGPDGAGPTEV
jgi:NADPH-dependent 2,4-dienoyl-CoA reductase/sulfur reductase-like enzyme